MHVVQNLVMLKKIKAAKIQLLDIDKKKDAQVIDDISLTPSQRFMRMFELIEFCALFSRGAKTPLDKEGWTVITLKKKTLGNDKETKA